MKLVAEATPLRLIHYLITAVTIPLVFAGLASSHVLAATSEETSGQACAPALKQL
jgi:hypothetical protein